MEIPVGIDWCNEEVTRTLPWDEKQFVKVRRMSGREKRRRQAIANVFKMGPDGDTEEMELTFVYDKVKEYEWETSIVDYRLVDKEGVVHTFSTQLKNRALYDHIEGPLEKFIDDLVLEVNKETEPETPIKSVKDVEGN